MISHLVFAITLQRVHCGCITSVHAFTLLDAGGIECMTCARKNVLVVWNILVVSHFLHLLFFSMIMYGFEYGAEDAYDAISGLPFFSVILNMLSNLFPHYTELVSKFGTFYLYTNLHFLLGNVYFCFLCKGSWKS